jgi:hypothetical protein
MPGLVPDILFIFYRNAQNAEPEGAGPVCVAGVFLCPFLAGNIAFSSIGA